jgi:O-antigen/teichoic acid export membrane protein
MELEEIKDINKIYSGKFIAKNIIYNLIGYFIPLLFAIAAIPFLIKGLGNEKFGILNLAWVIIGYFSFFDFGIGRALTKIIAEKIGTDQTNEIPGLFWTSFFLMLLISSIATVILIFLIPYFVHNVFIISKALQEETLKTFYILALSIPIVTTTAGIRGLLEAYQVFGVINVIRILLGIFMFLGPLICLTFTSSLYWIVIFLVIIRIIIWILYFIQCLKFNIKVKSKKYFETDLVKPILKLSGWMTVSNIIVPILVYSDRFLIGAIVSAAAIGYYATPYEAVTKLLLISGAITGVLFPAFSASHLNKPEFTKNISLLAVKYSFLFLYPAMLIIITFAHEGMRLWLGNNFANNSSLILQLLAVGVFFNGIAYIPFAYLQGIGRPDITAKVNLVELPFYFIALWFAIKNYGINGAALIWMLRMLVDALILFIFEQKMMTGHFEFNFKLTYIFILILTFASMFPILISNLLVKLILITIILLIFTYISWKLILSEKEKMFLISRIRIFD